jgi:hypothetical protein
MCMRGDRRRSYSGEKRKAIDLGEKEAIQS